MGSTADLRCQKHQWTQNRAIEIVQSELQSKKKKQKKKNQKENGKKEQNLKDLWDNIKHIIGTLKERKEWMILKNIWRNNGQNLKFDEKQIYIDSRSTNNPK